jgi:hypothetical protein
MSLGIMIIRAFGSFLLVASSFTHFIYLVVQFSCVRVSYIIYHYFYAVASSSRSSLRL